MASEFIFTMRNLGRFYPPDREVLKDVTLAFIPGAKIGVLGHNGAGKSSVLKIMAGIDDGFTGEARLSPGFSVGLLEQEPGLDEDKNVIENIMEGVAETQSLIDRYNEVLAMWGDPEADLEEVGSMQADLEDRIQSSNAWDLERQVEIAMDALRVPAAESSVGQLSGGERNRVHLAKMLRSGANLLLLDEPTNDLDVDTLRALEEALLDFAGSAFVISHDRWFLDRIATHILAFEGNSEVIWFEGNYEDYEADRRMRLGAEADQPHRIKYRPLTR